MGTAPGTKPELLRVLGPVTAVAMVAGSIIGSGIFAKPKIVAQNIQHFEWAALAWVLGGVLALLGGLVLAELVAMLPKAGGNYVFLKEGYGSLWGFLWGWVEFWISRTGSIAALATMFADALSDVVRDSMPLSYWDKKSITIAVIVTLTVINAIGVRWGGLVQNITTWLKVGSLAAIALLPFVLGQSHLEFLSQAGPKPDAGPLVGFGLAVLGVLWAYHGWMNIGPVAEELREPQRNVPRCLFMGIGIVIIAYLSANVAYYVVLPQTEMADARQTQVVAIRFAQRLFEPWGDSARTFAGCAISAAIMISVLGAANANIIIGSRTYFALGRDGLFPSALGQVHPRSHTPILALFWQVVWTVGLVLCAEWIRESPSDSPFDTLTNYVMFGAIIFETMSVASIFAFRRKHPDWPRPYRCLGYPLTPIIYVLILSAVLVNTVWAQPVKSVVGFGFIGLGAAVYLVRSRQARYEQPIADAGTSGGTAPQ
jgi:amino acid transporter